MIRRFKFKYDWNDFSPIPFDEEIETVRDLPLMDDLLYSSIAEISSINEPESIIKSIYILAGLLLDRLEKKTYTPENVQAVFRFACRMTREKNFYMEEQAKKDDVFQLFFYSFYDMATFARSGQSLRLDEIRLIFEAVKNREKIIQKYAAGSYDYRTEHVFLAKLFRDPRLKGYFLKALNFYESVPEHELLYDRETELDNIIDAMGTQGWTEFIGLLEKYLYYEDEIIPFTAINSLGRISGEQAAAALKRLRGRVLEGLMEMDKKQLAFLDLNITRAERGCNGVITEVSRKKSPWWKKIMAIRLLTGIREINVVRFLYRLTSDGYCEEFEARTGSDDFTGLKVRYPVREEAMAALESYEEDYIISIVGDKYIDKRESFYREMEWLYGNEDFDIYDEDWQEEDE